MRNLNRNIMFDKIKNRLNHSKMRKTINSATTALYSEKYDFLEIESTFALVGQKSKFEATLR